MTQDQTTKLTKHTMHLEEGQYDRLGRLHPNLARSLVIRKLINAYLVKHEPSLAVGTDTKGVSL